MSSYFNGYVVDISFGQHFLQHCGSLVYPLAMQLVAFEVVPSGSDYIRHLNSFLFEFEGIEARQTVRFAVLVR